MHNRRDKRVPMRLMGALEDDTIEQDDDNAPAEATDASPAWAEALMLWLSWNRALEKLENEKGRSCQRLERIQSLEAEMKILRDRAVKLSEALIAD